ncbi:RagB/SusD family nutrient uptake outer membrane protein [Mucilaginibacter ginkgonis]|uniref:RagB/SusD family nutrient uptake outer membrane protein n=1 Tax=Mucilaginibacter ginkgonis TaxID=2682091 RepID=A0A6I4I3V2_9SPHI|nr:RagB/SusD family nutrient uptake outer membrane protein [Mucilaginibacter ginkgonis]QQL49089.1 RagB/SusD family nutrient uptake outer membrane protein [Mucilaginibacter ginkgonis]
MKKKFLYIMLPALLSVTACKKTLDQQPQASLDASTAFTTRQGVEAGIVGVYDGVQSTGYMSLNYLIFPDLYADNITWTGTFPTWSQVFNKTILADNTDINTIWNALYSTINKANNIIAAAPNISDPAFAKDRAIGECETIRAMAYFDLVRMFGGGPTGYNQAGGLGVPLRLKPTLTTADATPVARATEADVYTQVLADLDDAIAKLPTSVGTGRVNKYVAQALKARVQLYRQQWADAEALCTSVIAGPYTLVSGGSYATIYTSRNTSESLWELQYNATDANNIAFYYYPSNLGGRNEVSSATSLRDAFEANDVRKAVNYTTTTPTAKTLKYTQVTPGIDDVMMMRLAEVYLTRAEARAMLGNLPGATADLNVIRVRAGIGNTTAVTQADLLTAIRKERRLELAHEGQRHFDLRRYNQTGIAQTFRNLFPIPQQEVLSSNGVTVQNPGY